MSSQVNYLTDEGDDPGGGANTTASMLHHFLYAHGIGEQHLRFHADNCIGQNKNNMLMGYLKWRIRTTSALTCDAYYMLRIVPQLAIIHLAQQCTDRDVWMVPAVVGDVLLICMCSSHSTVVLCI